ncbi:MAG: MBOAT family protein [Candidatus Latescibacteria bacterium]|nr:MBOAT family protein [Candidatus Latescibacterota bacterium]
MPFNTWIFSIFFIVTLLVYIALRPTKFWLLWLLLASYFFYGWLNPLYLILIGYSTLVTFISGMMIGNTEKRKLWLGICITNSLLLLGFFKYAAFVAENINRLFEVLNVTASIPKPGFLLPIGISFYTFISMGYIIDVYRGKISAERNIVKLASFISFFPYLLAGPIERAQNILPQFNTPPTINRDNITEGFSLFIVGLFKKIALADFLALYVNKVYGDPSQFQSPALLLATYAFAWQIYFDFSGYTDMARGVARMMGFKLMLNFNNPYLSTSLGEFWGRWHISLSTWFKDYLYIPLGGNRHGHFNTYRNMIITMLVAGLWHGAAWNFVIWGALHALGRSITRDLERTKIYSERVPKIAKQFLIFHIVCLSWIFFRAETFGKAMTVLKGIFSCSLTDPKFSITALLFMGCILLYQFIYESNFRRILELSAVKVILMLSMILYMVFFRTSGYEIFLYFRF